MLSHAIKSHSAMLFEICQGRHYINVTIIYLFLPFIEHLDDVKAYIIIGNLSIYKKRFEHTVIFFPLVNILDTGQREWRLIALDTATLSSKETDT